MFVMMPMIMLVIKTTIMTTITMVMLVLLATMAMMVTTVMMTARRNRKGVRAGIDQDEGTYEEADAGTD